MTLEERRLWEWISWLEDGVVGLLNHEKMVIFKKIREGKTLKEYLKENGKEDLYVQYRGGR